MQSQTVVNTGTAKIIALECRCLRCREAIIPATQSYIKLLSPDGEYMLYLHTKCIADAAQVKQGRAQ